MRRRLLHWCSEPPKLEASLEATPKARIWLSEARGIDPFDVGASRIRVALHLSGQLCDLHGRIGLACQRLLPRDVIGPVA